MGELNKSDDKDEANDYSKEYYKTNGNNDDKEHKGNNNYNYDKII